MVSQQKIDDYLTCVESLVGRFGEHVRLEVSSVEEAVLAHMLDVLEAKDGLVVQSGSSSAAVLDIEGFFHSELARSNFYPTLVAFASGLADQVDEFRELYLESILGLPHVELGDEDKDVLSNQGAAAIGAMEGHVLKVGSNLRHLLSRSLGGVSISELTRGVIEVVRELNRVESIGFDQWMTWFRLFGHLSYQVVEEQGYALRFRYHGKIVENTRDFCARLMGSSSFSRSEIERMDNGQVPDVFVNCGGYGCKHFWLGELTVA